MNNGTIKNALGSGDAPLSAEIELLDNELDEVSGGACGTFTCGVYRVWDAEI